MEVKLKELLNLINLRFSGPESCRMQDMIVGKIDFDEEEIKNYLKRLKDYGGINGNYNEEKDRKDAETYFDLYNTYIESRYKNKKVEY